MLSEHFFVYVNFTFSFAMEIFPFFVKSKLFLNILCRIYNCKFTVHRQDNFVLKSYVNTAIYRYMGYILFIIHVHLY